MLAVACFLAASARAQETAATAASGAAAPAGGPGVVAPPSSVGPDFEGEPVEVVDTALPGAARAPAAQSAVVDASRFGGEVRSVSELLLTAPGATIHALGGPGQAATLSLRGASADQSLVLLDGIPLQGPGGGAADLSLLPATLLERLVVTRGVLGAQFGAGALGGAVELLPRAARHERSFGAQLSYGSFGSVQLSADAASPAGENGSALLAVEADRTSGNFDYARALTPEIPGAPLFGFTRENADARRGSALGRFVQKLGPQTELDLLAQGSLAERGLPGSAGAPTLQSRELDEGGLAGLRLRGLAGGSTYSLRAFGRLDRVDLRGVQVIGDCVDGESGCPRLDQRSSTARAEGEFGTPLGEAAWLKAQLSGGEEWIHGGATGPHQRALFAGSLAADLRLGALSLHPALRLDAIGAERGLSPALGLLWKMYKIPVELRAGWGLSFRAPSFSELYLQRGGLDSNPDLRPERAWSVDAGAAWRGERLTLSAGVFWSEYRDLVIYELYPPARVKPFNFGRARIRGFELQALVQLPLGLLAEASYSFLDARDLRDGAEYGQPLAYRPPHRLFTRLARRGDRLEGYGELSFSAALPRNQFGTAFLQRQLVFNAGAGVRAAGPLWLDLEAKNLLDDQTLEDLFQYPLPGFSIALIARARL